MNIAAYVINLERSAERWQRIAQAAEGRGLALRRVEAVDGANIASEDRVGLDAETFERLNGREALPGEYGCYRSHLRALETFLADGAPHALILEDDIVPGERTMDRIAAVLEAAPPFGAIKLVNHRARFMIRATRSAEGDDIGRTLHGPQGSASAYMVTREGAKRLLAELATMTLPWDVALERFWSHGCDIYSVRENLFEFSEHRAKSTIADSYEYDRFSPSGRLRTGLFRTGEHISRLHNVFLRPASLGPAVSAREYSTSTGHGAWGVVAPAAVLLFVSSLWYETDVYRFVGVAMVLTALVHYFRDDLWTYSKALIGWAGFACMAWFLYVAARFGNTFLFHPHKGIGTSEGIYLFPLLYPTFGYAMFLFVRRPFDAVIAFMVASLAIFLAGTDYAGILADSRTTTWLHNNTIHASIAAGFILLLSIAFAGHLMRRAGLEQSTRLLLLGLAGAVFVFAITNVYVLESKGVWLAIGVSLPLLAVTVALTDDSRAARLVASGALVIAVLGAIAFRETLWQVSDSSAELAAAIARDLGSGLGLRESLERLLAEETLTKNLHERLLLWSNALRVWGEAPFLGSGISWLFLWDNSPEAQPYNLLHNGYLEIAIRYGLFGLAFYGWLYAWCVTRVWQAARAGLVDMAAFQAYLACLVYFGVTILTNSNVRLAIGETYMWFAASFAFYCYYLLQRKGVARPRIYF